MTDNPWVTMAEARKNAGSSVVGNSTTGSTPKSNSDTRPLVGGYAYYQSGGYSGIPTSGNRVPQMSTVFDYKQQLSQIRATSPKQYQALLGQLRAAGYLGARANSLSSIETAFNTVLEDAAALYQTNPDAKNLSVWDFLYSRATKGADKNGSGPGGGGSGSGGPFSNSTVNFTNQFDAREVVDNALNQWLGRDATDEERQKFWKQLNAGEAANPQVDAGVSGKGGTSRATSGGFNARVAAEDFAKSRKDYAETTFATTAMELIQKSIMGDQTEGLM